jgi:1,4-dihydroxy-2-naphthoate octaprenyltransferase
VTPADWTLTRRWLFALKPASWPKLLVPVLLGQGLGIAAAGRVSLGALGFGVGFALLDIAFIVLLNDWGDREVDSLKRRMFPRAGSPKTIPDGVLPATHVLLAGVVAGLAAVVLSLVAAWLVERPALAWLGPGCLAVFVAYTLPPLRLNYRGGGELLEMLGVGVLLPLMNAYAQSGELAFREAWALPGFAALSLASAVASGLGDEESDRRGGKRTVVTLLGNRSGRRIAEVSLVLGAASWVAAGLGPLPASVAVPAAALVLVEWVLVRRASKAATTGAFAAQGIYKRNLHRAIWGGGAALGVLSAAHGLLG